MALKLSKNPTFVTKAIILVPTDDGQVEQSISVRFRVLQEDGLEVASPEFLKRAILRIDDVVDDDDTPLASSDALIDQVIAQPYTRLPLVKAYFQALSGARVGN